MTVHTAYDWGTHMARNGESLENIPEHFTSIEKEVCEEAYNEYITSKQFHDDLYDDLESIDMNSMLMDNDNMEELNFH